MKRKITNGFDNFMLDDDTRKNALDNILWMVSSDQTGGTDRADDAPAPVRTPEKEARLMKTNKRKRFGAVAAGILGGILLMGGVAYAAGWFGLKDLTGEEKSVELTLKVPEKGRQAKEDAAGTRTPAESQAPETRHETMYYMELSLVGPKGSPEYEAQMEWGDFYWQHYSETNGSDDNEERPCESYYDIYGCWDQEMKDKLDEILEKYGLEPHQTYAGTNSLDVLCKEIGIRRIFPELKERTGYHAASQDYWYYDDGSFSIERMVDWEDMENSFVFHMDCCKKGVLNDVALNIDDPSHYTEWDYTTTSGVHVHAIESTEEYLSKNGVVIDPSVVFIIDRPESVVSIIIHYDNIPHKDGSRSHDYKILSHEELQAFLESICLENIP